MARSSTSAREPSTTPRRFMIVATNEGGGDIQPLLAIAGGLLARGHTIVGFGDASVPPKMAPLGISTIVAAPELALGAQYAAAARETGHLPPERQTEWLCDRLITWAERLAPVIEQAAEEQRADVLVAAQFGSGAVRLAAERCRLPWVAVNSTFYVGPNPPRPLEADFGTRTALFRDFFAPNLDRATLVLHASDPEFDFGFDGLPPHHHYAGPLFWNPIDDCPSYLAEPGDPWALVTLSTHTQDDVPIARASLEGFRELPVRVLLTLGGHADEDLGTLPENARVERYVAHDPVLERAALMVSSAGHGAVMRALWHGVPMILVPWGRDQGGVAARAARLGTAAIIARGQLTAELLGTTARRLLEDPAIAARAKSISRRMRTEDPVAKACTMLEAV